MARERYGNGYKGRAATRRKMRANFRGFADHSPRSLKPVHGNVGHRGSIRMAQSNGTPVEVAMSENLAERAADSHRSRAIGGVLMPHLYKRTGNHWKTPRRFDRREPEQEEEESQPLQRTGASRSLKDIIKAKPRRRAPWK